MKFLLKIPISVLVFPLVAILYALQTVPLVGVFLMMLAAPLWTGTLLNLGMIGLVLEVPIRRFALDTARTSLLWLVIPFAYFGWYASMAYPDQMALRNLQTQYDASNAIVSIPLDQEKHELVLKGGAHSYAGALTQDFGLGIAYVENENTTQGYLSTRLLEKEKCTQIRNEPMLRAAFIHVFGFHDGEVLGRRRSASRFCSLRMPAKPEKPTLVVASSVTEGLFEGLPVKTVENRIQTPDGSEFVLRGGTAAPYPWFPRPILGCALNSGAPSWDCFSWFSRERFTTIVSSENRYGADVRNLANALGLSHTPPHERATTGSDTIHEKLRQAINVQLERDIADVQEAIADPSIRLTVHSIKVLQRSPDELQSLAPQIVEGIKRAGQVVENPYQYRETGRTLAQLFGKLPQNVQDAYAEEMTLLYRKADAANDGRHWLYQADVLLRFRKPAASIG